MAKDNKITIKVDADMSGFDKILKKMRDDFDQMVNKGLMGQMNHVPLMHVLSKPSKSEKSAHFVPYVEDVKEPVVGQLAIQRGFAYDVDVVWDGTRWNPLPGVGKSYHSSTMGIDVAGPATDANTTVLYSVKSKQAILEEMQEVKIMEETKSRIEVYKSKGRKVKL